MKLLLLALFLTCFIGSNAQKEIRLEQLKEYIGDSVKVQGKISGMVANSGRRNQKPTFLYVGGNYPKQMLTISISPAVRRQLQTTPFLTDVGNVVWVSGKVEKYKGQTLIVLKIPASSTSYRTCRAIVNKICWLQVCPSQTIYCILVPPCVVPLHMVLASI